MSQIAKSSEKAAIRNFKSMKWIWPYVSRLLSHFNFPHLWFRLCMPAT